jgi:tetratricopeptide (TPR) repeat protein
LTELQKKYRGKGVVVIGVSVDEGEKRKTRGDVAPFVRERGDQMDYVVALDDADRSTRKAYMESFLFDSIPNAFVIDRRGKLAWAGQPQETPSGGLDWSRLDQAVADIVAGTYDLKAAQQADRERRVVAESRRKALETMNRYFELAKSSAQPAGAEKLGQETFTALGQDAALLNDFAWRMLTDEELKFRDLKLALQVAKAAYDAAQGVSPSITDTYARALFDNGKRKEAIAYQKKAIKLAEDDPALREELEGTLKKYEAAGQ